MRARTMRCLCRRAGNAAQYARYFFAALGHGAIGWSTFGLDLTGYANAPLGAPVVDDKLIDLFALNNEIVGPMDREIARLNFEGKLQAVCGRPGGAFADTGVWAVDGDGGAMGCGCLAERSGARRRRRTRTRRGARWWLSLGPDEFLVTGVSARVDFRPTDTASGKHREFVRVEEGTYVDGKWKFLRIWNGDQTDYGLNFTTQPQVLRVTLMTY